MAGLAADHAAERDNALVGLLAIGRAIEAHDDRAGNFQRARNRNDVERRLRVAQDPFGATQQHVGDVLVVARFHDQHARTLDAGLLALRCSARPCHFGLRLTGPSLASGVAW